MKTTHLLFPCIALLALSCSDAKFNASDRKKDQPDPAVPVEPPTTGDPTDNGDPVAYSLNCDRKDPLVVDLKSKVDKKIKVKGEFCPKSFGKLSVLFVVDFSGSMGAYNGQPGSDPGSFLTQSCGRRKAVESIIAKIKADMRTEDDINVGLVQFGTDARIAAPLAKLANFENSTVGYSSLCGSNMGSTNYEAAFQKTKEAFGTTDGNKVVFFISDGLPNAYNGSYPNTSEDEAGKQKGLTAAQDLTSAVKDMTLNVVFLSGENKDAAQTYLESITGDKTKVKLADNAGSLADKIVELSIPSVSINKETVSAELVFGEQKKAVKIVKLEPDATRKSVWVFESEEFTALGKAGSEALNQVTIKVSDNAKIEYQQRIDIKFTEQK
jgi:uncharacterized protein YegL